jgi:phosphoglycolate phosphatase-like HAD superfamily hydrolase
MIGDTPADVMAGKAAGCRTVLVLTHGNGFDMPEEPDYTAKDLLAAVALVT